MFFEKRSTIVGKKRIFATKNNIVKVIVKEMLMPLQTVEATNNENGEGECPRDGVPAGDCGMRVFHPIYVNNEENAGSDDYASKVVSYYQVTLSDPLQFDYVMSFLTTRLYLHQIFQVVLENRNQLVCTVKTGCVSEGEAS